MADQVQASHILLMYAGSMRSSATRSQDEAKTQIAEIEGKLKAGESFADLARAHSDCPSGQQGGDLGKFGRGQMVKEFDEAVFNGEVGAVQGPVKTQFGYHLLQVTSRED